MTDWPPAENCRALARAVLIRAFEDLKNPEYRADALAWLHSARASVMMVAVDLDPDAVDRAIKNALRGPRIRAGIKQWRRYIDQMAA